jgi:hypothetical protein
MLQRGRNVRGRIVDLIAYLFTGNPKKSVVTFLAAIGPVSHHLQYSVHHSTPVRAPHYCAATMRACMLYAANATSRHGIYLRLPTAPHRAVVEETDNPHQPRSKPAEQPVEKLRETVPVHTSHGILL